MGYNGLLGEVEDVRAWPPSVQRVHDDEGLRRRLRAGGRPTAEAHAEENLDARWEELLDGFVERGGPDED